MSIASGFLRLRLPGDAWAAHASLDDGFFYDQPWAFEYTSAASPSGWTTQAAEMDYGAASASWWIHVRHTGVLSDGEPVAQAETIATRAADSPPGAPPAYSYRDAPSIVPLVVAEPPAPVQSPSGFVAAHVFAFIPAGPVIQITVGCTRESDWASRDARVDRVVAGLSLGGTSPALAREYQLALTRDALTLRPPAGWYITHQLTDARSRYIVRRATVRGADVDTLTIDVERGAAPSRASRASRTASLRIGSRTLRFSEATAEPARTWTYRACASGACETWTLSGIADPARSIMKMVLQAGRFSAR